MYGIFVNEDGGVRYAEAIVKGYKPIETRNRNMLASLVGKRVAVVRTRRGKNPMIVGYVDIMGAFFHDKEWMHAHRDLTLIPEGSKHDCVNRGKWCYYLATPMTCKPFDLPKDAVRHGRSYCEFIDEYLREV